VATAGQSGTLVTSGAAWLAGAFASAGGGPGIGRRAAQQLARRELARSLYAEPLRTRFARWLARLLGRLLGDASSFPGGWWTVVALACALVVVAAGVGYWIRPGAGRGGRMTGGLLTGSRLTAADHRREAERTAASGDYATAIIERMRAVAVEIEGRGILTARPGRTADELAAQAGRALPGLAAGLAAAALLFDDVRYGGRAGTAASYERVLDLDAAVQRASVARPEPVATGPAAP
jgi:hypothetical protein